jgi:hypothetical protein
LLNQPYVYKVSPNRLFTQSSSPTTLLVYVSNDYNDAVEKPSSRKEFLFCKVAPGIITKVVSVLKNEALDCNRTAEDRIHNSGHQQHSLFQGRECRTNLTIYTCKVPYLPAALASTTFQVEILNQMGSFVGSTLLPGEGSVEFIQRPYMSSVLP